MYRDQETSIIIGARPKLLGPNDKEFDRRFCFLAFTAWMGYQSYWLNSKCAHDYTCIQIFTDDSLPS